VIKCEPLNREFQLIEGQGRQRSFIHEREFRFIIYDPAEVDDLSSDILTADEVVLGGTIQLSKKYRERISSNLGKGISVPINLENFLLEIHFGSAMDAGTKDKIRKKLMELQLTITCHESEV
jgi:hypothetical protein